MTQQRPGLMEVIRFIIVGGVATAIHYGVYYLCSLLIEVNIAYTIGYLVSFVANYFLSSYFTFNTGTSAKKAVGFGVSHLINYLLHIGLLNIYIYLGVNEKIAPIFVFAVAIPVNFLLVRRVLK
ncbi:MAG: GtrA family protein [Rikenellaceae bacterium]